VYGQVYNTHSPEYIAGQVKLLKEKYSADHIWFCDDIFGLKPGWVKAFDEAVNKDNIKLPFKCLSRADLLLKEDNISHLANAGCESIWIGAESGSQKIWIRAQQLKKFMKQPACSKSTASRHVSSCSSAIPVKQ